MIDAKACGLARLAVDVALCIGPVLQSGLIFQVWRRFPEQMPCCDVTSVCPESAPANLDAGSGTAAFSATGVPGLIAGAGGPIFPILSFYVDESVHLKVILWTIWVRCQFLEKMIAVCEN
ncbi:hypothetical protein [Aquabacterium sp.]|uniref:hypothetical protein n=1 Tax=Aquabacterium sp. TaxID=1872578 RepID=UPI002E368550|nr:hypothetical protein [Aquabacterium sp.]HEX5312562.1 hypothetical protein [Aquabacterium sp.]